MKASALITGGGVYIGSGDDKLYKLSEATGTVAWTVATGRPTTASPSTFQSDLLVGSGDGLLYHVSPGGQVIYKSGTGAPIVGVAASWASWSWKPRPDRASHRTRSRCPIGLESHRRLGAGVDADDREW